MTLAEREEILREIAAHIRDSVEAGTPTEAVLTGLGTPAQLAAEYRDGALIRAASKSMSPVTLLRATLRVATKGISGIIVFLLGFVGYITGGTLVLGGILKPFAPNYIGLFTTNASSGVISGQVGLVTGGSQTNVGSHEIFGIWSIPIAIVGGIVTFLLTTLAIRAFLRLSQKVQRSL
ncbi:MAG: hypothetical protein WBY53_02860 [Acidobacteriaceae bacterium]